MDYLDRKHRPIRKYYMAGCHSGPKADCFDRKAYQGSAPRVVAMACVGLADETHFTKEWKFLQARYKVLDSDIYSGVCLRNHDFISAVVAMLPFHYPEILIEVWDWHYFVLHHINEKHLTRGVIEALGGPVGLASGALAYAPNRVSALVAAYCHPTEQNVMLAKKKCRAPGYWEFLAVAGFLKESHDPAAKINPLVTLADRLLRRLVSNGEKLAKAKIYLADIQRTAPGPESVKTKNGAIIYRSSENAVEKLARVLAHIAAESVFNAAFSATGIDAGAEAKLAAIASSSRYHSGRTINAAFSDSSKIAVLIR